MRAFTWRWTWIRIRRRENGDLLGSAVFSVGLFCVLGIHESGKKIEQEARRRAGEKRTRIILSGNHLPLLRSPRLRASCSLFSS